MPCRRKTWLLSTILIAALGGCGEETAEERQPSAAEVRAYIADIERKEAAHKADTIRASRAKEEAARKEHSERLKAEN